MFLLGMDGLRLLLATDLIGLRTDDLTTFLLAAMLLDLAIMRLAAMEAGITLFIGLRDTDLTTGDRTILLEASDDLIMGALATLRLTGAMLLATLLTMLLEAIDGLAILLLANTLLLIGALATCLIIPALLWATLLLAAALLPHPPHGLLTADLDIAGLDRGLLIRFLSYILYTSKVYLEICKQMNFINVRFSFPAWSRSGSYTYSSSCCSSQQCCL